MRLNSPALDAEVAGTTSGDVLEVNAWRGGVLTEQALAISGWSLSWDATRQVQGQGTFTVADPDGRLAPWGLADALGPGGSRLQVTWVSGLSGIRVPLGWWRIRRADPAETWRLLPTSYTQTTRGTVAYVRTNHHGDPAATATTTANLWAYSNGTGGAVTQAVVTGASDGPPILPGGGRLRTYRRATITAAATGGSAGPYTQTIVTGGGVAGAQSAQSMWARTNRAVSGLVYIRFYLASTVVNTLSYPLTFTAGAWTRLAGSLTASGPWDRMRVWFVPTNTVPHLPQVGDVWDFTGALMELGTTVVGDYLDGSLPNTRARDYAWTGPANASPSTLTEWNMTTTRVHTPPVRVSGGGSVQVQADEETATVALNRLDAEVVKSPTCLAEIRRLLADIGPVVVTGVTDGPVPAGLVYGDSRADAVDDLLTSVLAVMRMGPDGSFEVVPAAGVGPVWTLAGGEDGVLVNTVRSLSDEGVYNAATSTGETATGQPLVGRAQRQGGPLAWGGPYGKVPVFHRAVAQTAAGVQADADTTLATLAAAGEVDLAVTCLAHPGVQPNDRVTVLAPTHGGDAPLEGRVVGMTLASAGGGDGTTPAKSMALTVRVSADTLEAVARRVARTRV